MQKNSSNLKDRFDAIVMLTWSDWFTEPVSNRYHYATRFAKHLPVIFVQPDKEDGGGYQFEETNIENIVVLHIGVNYTEKQKNSLDQALYSKKVFKPLLWIYNLHFADYLKERYAPLKIFHATEDYLEMKDVRKFFEGNIRKILGEIDLMVAVSKKVLDNYNSLGIETYETLLLPNGVDYKIWSLTEEEKQEIQSSDKKNILLYQGGVNNRLNFKLLKELLNIMPDWQLWMCGKNDGSTEVKEFLNAHKNITYFGEKEINEVRNLCKQAVIGLIPFKQLPKIYNSMPLKTFEYLSTGLPVVSIHIEELQKFPDVIDIASTAEEFKESIIRNAPLRCNIEHMNKCLDIARLQDYDCRFEQLLQWLKNKKDREYKFTRKRIGVLYDKNSNHVFTIKNYLDMFQRYSRHQMEYVPATGNEECGEKGLEDFDAVIIFYSIRVCFESHLSASYDNALVKYKKHKILMTQDDYDMTEVTRKAIERLGIQTELTVVPDFSIPKVYTKSRFPDVVFFNVLTGYISEEMSQNDSTVPIADRKIFIGYRGRDIGFWYGNLGRDKMEIGIKMKKICQERGIPIDIEWTADKRIYTDKWLKWMSSCKATLGTESGSNIYDEYGVIKKNVEKELEDNPDATYEEIFDKYLKDYEGKIVTNALSPKMFEAISLKTVLIMYEGYYSGILKADQHYIALKKDFSNIDDVLNKLQNDKFLQEFADKAYLDIVLNEKLTYKWLLSFIDDCIDFKPKVIELPMPEVIVENKRFRSIVKKTREFILHLWYCFMESKFLKPMKRTFLYKGVKKYLLILYRLIKD